MKRIALAFTALLIVAVAAPLYAIERGRNDDIVNEVIKMWKSNVAEETIIQYVHKSDARFAVSADDVIDMADAKVPRTVIKAVLDEADDRGDRSRERTVERRTVYVPSYYGGWYGYRSSFWDPWYYDPFYYRPGISIGIGFGGRHFRGRHR